ncbi:hypothetical protein Sjap_006637 [Stephania japonica]|uniref:Uncharacterized protein n=1 Tax=Stephania japonica TaxID=461633 RepID=A0AAP0K7Y4_9MAGN
MMSKSDISWDKVVSPPKIESNGKRKLNPPFAGPLRSNKTHTFHSLFALTVLRFPSPNVSADRELEFVSFRFGFVRSFARFSVASYSDVVLSFGFWLLDDREVGVGVDGDGF